MKLVDCNVARVVCLLVLAFAAAPAFPATKATAAKPMVDLREHPTGGKTPVEVSVGIYITNFVAIDESHESFEVGGFHMAQWKDPRLALTPDPLANGKDGRKRLRSYQLGELWVPAIEGANTISHTTNQYVLEADPAGTVTYRERFESVLSNNFDLRRFPLDTQALRFEYQPFVSSASDFRFAAQALAGSGISKEETTELAAWRLQNLTYNADKLTGDPFVPETHEAEFQVLVTRRWGFYAWKIFLPLMMMAVIPTVVFWIDVKEFDWILKIPMTMLLSMVAFGFTITRDLPKTGYMTFMDAFFVVSFTFCFACMVEITVVYLLQKHGRRPLAEKLHRAGRWGYPGSYAGALLILALAFLL